MRTIKAIIALGLTLVSIMPVLADNSAKAAKTDKAASTTITAKTANTDNGAKAGAPAPSEDGNAKTGESQTSSHAEKKHEHRRYDSTRRAPGKRQVMSLPDLTDKQRSQIQAIYQGKEAQFSDLTRQIQDIKADEWQQIQGILTPAQIESLGGKGVVSGTSGASAAPTLSSPPVPAKK